ncbi:MAG: tetratricopeptide repeat protein [Acidobacteriota bacterium]
MALLSRGDLWGAAQTFRQALLIDPLRFDFHLELGCTLAKNPRWHCEAERRLRRCLELDPKNAESFYLLGLLYRENGMELRAEMELRKALEIEPENPRYKDAMTAPKR